MKFKVIAKHDRNECDIESRVAIVGGSLHWQVRRAGQDNWELAGCINEEGRAYFYRHNLESVGATTGKCYQD